jgi:hypothetical protein
MVSGCRSQGTGWCGRWAACHWDTSAGAVYCDLFQVPSFRWQVGAMTVGYLAMRGLGPIGHNFG